LPVILTGDEAPPWIDPGTDDAEKLTELLQPFSPDNMTYYAVDPIVGNVK
jgi:putative SOS response-associated peptidase YedK